MRVKSPECQRQNGAGPEAKNKAPFPERRLFFSLLQAVKSPDFAIQLCYKGVQ
jgi:hypothetical protein